jgi:tRNA (Thr-GGU) A37 N-methylase
MTAITKMKRKFIFLFIVLPLLFMISYFGEPVQARLQAAAVQNVVPSQDAQRKIAPEVRQALDSLEEGEMMTIIVTLVDQADLSQVPGAGRAARQQGVIRALQAKSYTSQRDIRRF